MRIALIEGLGSYHSGRWLSGALESDLMAQGHVVGVYPYTRNIIPPMDVIVAHSFGAGYAIKNDFPCKLLITLDARRWDFWNNNRLKKPSKAKKHYNIYQTGFLRGYPIDRAINFKALDSSHLTVARDKKELILTLIQKCNET